MIIRKVLLNESNEYTLCHIACWRCAYKNIISDEYLNNMEKDYEQRAIRFKKSLAEENILYYCVIDDNKMVGRLVFGKSRDVDKQDAGEIMAIYLLKEYWNKGYGKKMMDFAINTLKNNGFRR